MFGGLELILGGQMCCGIVKDERSDTALRQPPVHPLDLTGRR
jgi:hypothetical protein